MGEGWAASTPTSPSPYRSSSLPPRVIRLHPLQPPRYPRVVPAGASGVSAPSAPLTSSGSGGGRGKGGLAVARPPLRRPRSPSPLQDVSHPPPTSSWMKLVRLMRSGGLIWRLRFVLDPHGETAPPRDSPVAVVPNRWNTPPPPWPNLATAHHPHSDPNQVLDMLVVISFQATARQYLKYFVIWYHSTHYCHSCHTFVVNPSVSLWVFVS